MPSLFEDCKLYFGTDNLYQVLNVQKDADQSSLKRAYYKVSLRVHPDRAKDEEKEESTKKFQTLGKIYSILSNAENRTIYNETGEVDDENDITQDRDWYDYWRLLFKKISMTDIDKFEKEYKGSEEETSDLVAAYINHEGDMSAIMETMMCATAEDEPRYHEILMKKIKQKEIQEFENFTNECAKKKKNRKRKADKEAREAAEMKSELGLGEGEDALKRAIMERHQNRQKQTDDFFAQLEKKYASSSKKKSKPKK